MSSLQGVQIRRLAASDLDAVVVLERESESAPHWSRAEYLLYLVDSEGASLRRFGLVAEAGGVFAGFALLRCLTVPGATDAELESILVAPAWRGQGIGTALMGSALELAAGLGARQLELEARASNAGAMRLYRRLGMSLTGRREGYYHDPEEDAVLMRIEL